MFRFKSALSIFFLVLTVCLAPLSAGAQPVIQMLPSTPPPQFWPGQRLSKTFDDVQMDSKLGASGVLVGNSGYMVVGGPNHNSRGTIALIPPSAFDPNEPEHNLSTPLIDYEVAPTTGIDLGAAIAAIDDDIIAVSCPDDGTGAVLVGDKADIAQGRFVQNAAPTKITEADLGLSYPLATSGGHKNKIGDGLKVITSGNTKLLIVGASAAKMDPTSGCGSNCESGGLWAAFKINSNGTIQKPAVHVQWNPLHTPNPQSGLPCGGWPADSNGEHGHSIAATDFDGDGKTDLIVGAPGADEYCASSNYDIGEVYVMKAMGPNADQPWPWQWQENIFNFDWLSCNPTNPGCPELRTVSGDRHGDQVDAYRDGDFNVVVTNSPGYDKPSGNSNGGVIVHTRNIGWQVPGNPTIYLNWEAKARLGSNRNDSDAGQSTFIKVEQDSSGDKSLEVAITMPGYNVGVGQSQTTVRGLSSTVIAALKDSSGVTFFDESTAKFTYLHSPTPGQVTEHGAGASALLLGDITDDGHQEVAFGTSLGGADYNNGTIVSVGQGVYNLAPQGNVITLQNGANWTFPIIPGIAQYIDTDVRAGVPYVVPLVTNPVEGGTFDIEIIAPNDIGYEPTNCNNPATDLAWWGGTVYKGHFGPPAVGPHPFHDATQTNNDPLCPGGASTNPYDQCNGPESVVSGNWGPWTGYWQCNDQLPNCTQTCPVSQQQYPECYEYLPYVLDTCKIVNGKAVASMTISITANIPSLAGNVYDSDFQIIKQTQPNPSPKWLGTNTHGIRVLVGCPDINGDGAPDPC